MPGYVPWSDRRWSRRRRDDQRWRTPTQTVRSLLIYSGLSLALFILGILMGWLGVIVTGGVVAGLSLVESAIFLPRALAASRSREAIDRRRPPTP
jgi:Zn-dependent membrane protease YugP